MKLVSNFRFCMIALVIACWSSLYAGVLIPRTVLFGNPEKAYAQVSPDGTRLAYCAPVNGVLNIWVKMVGHDDDKAITFATSRGIYHYYWAYNNKQILYLQDTNGNENHHCYCIDLPTGVTRDLTPFGGVKASVIALNKHLPDELVVMMNKDNPKLFDAYRLNLMSGNMIKVASNPGNVSLWIADKDLHVRAAIATNSDGKQLLLVRNSTADQWRTLLQVDFEDTLQDELYNGVLGFSRDGKHLFLNSSIGSNTRSLIKIDVQTGKRETVAGDPEYDIEHVIFDVDTYEPQIISWQKERLEYRILSPSLQKEWNSIKAVCNGDLNYIQRTVDGSQWVLGFSHDNRSYEYYIYDRAQKTGKLLFRARPSLNSYALATMRPVVVTARDGLKIHGYLTCPVGVEEKNLPLILVVHGGPFFRDTWGYNPIAQLFANRGCACLQLNFRGSSGYGKAFLAAGNGQWGAKMHDDLIDGVNWAINQKIADPKKIAIYGASYGGYAALVGATFTPDVFCCAIDYCGSSNLITVLKTLPPYWSLAQWEKRIGNLSDEEFLKSRSPLFNIDRIKIPLLIAHGANDVRVPQTESEQLVQALKKKNISHEYLLFPDEGHGFVRPQNRLKFYAAVERFLARHLGCLCEPEV